MKFFIPLVFVAGALASPVALESRQLLSSSTTSNDYVKGGCKPVVMIYARASTESGNVGTLGAPLKSGLERAYPGNFALQGVEYPADLASNFLPLGSGQDSIDEMARLITDVATKCPSAKIAAGGYSQGTAVAARSVAQLPANIRDRVGAVVLFGYTQNDQLNGGIPGYPQDRVKVFCNTGDLVCEGTLTIALPHFMYSGKVTEAVSFIVSKLGN